MKHLDFFTTTRKPPAIRTRPELSFAKSFVFPGEFYERTAGAISRKSASAGTGRAWAVCWKERWKKLCHAERHAFRDAEILRGASVRSVFRAQYCFRLPADKSRFRPPSGIRGADTQAGRYLPGGSEPSVARRSAISRSRSLPRPAASLFTPSFPPSLPLSFSRPLRASAPLATPRNII